MAETELRGSVRVRANQDHLCWDEADMGPLAAKVAQHGPGPLEVEQSVPIGGPMVHVVVDRAGTEEHFVRS